MNAAGTHEQVDSCTAELPMLGFKQARQKVLDELAKSSTAPKSENVPLGNALGRILDEEILANRDYLRRWLNWLDDLGTADDTRRRIVRSRSELRNGEGLRAGIWHQGRLAGTVSLHAMSLGDRKASMG